MVKIEVSQFSIFYKQNKNKIRQKETQRWSKLSKTYLLEYDNDQKIRISSKTKIDMRLTKLIYTISVNWHMHIPFS